MLATNCSLLLVARRNEISLEHERNLRYMVYCMETGCALAEKNGLSKVLVIVDYYDVSEVGPGWSTVLLSVDLPSIHIE